MTLENSGCEETVAELDPTVIIRPGGTFYGLFGLAGAALAFGMAWLAGKLWGGTA